ncbi:methylenetetrahydrofolate--tRNA-(uracil(54)-C(5))-methyltransferase (FADH(2)-oxidizing) TrmFO [Sandaracinobacter sp. RS1-74]|uniref:methylenetetrahydrofolate--tRNA-(uracil(54)- C(5))-methyltransferase (FADH(2)-oxidizing) TrmFO n=1 Tax=Sandaracinobacteroides sayramensis TaxID=2913411 RepID=UPI001EDC58D4|nr:methylenetetrahydrofolate--tRNA-(uracil(54)-C(5))-methyltransferase (FADH(2)-oxidizing) TrmFO [Sandaracinobacteroides sayramensis]MCG2841913.1 methylenetetrahydrofolate--tRNA-(uracil(54)-C(5))-methyltransferase (FADH(2)-oxidizing) TrmFO [Sandaracinobacteroides sayramensis]
MPETVHIIGGGLAGSEAAWQLARRRIPVVLHEMRGGKMTPAHRTDGLAELVCSNSFRSDDSDHNAVGLLHHEMRALDSLVMRAADAARVPAGSALAVDRDLFSAGVTAALEAHPLVTVERGEVQAPDPAWKHVLIATGPLTSEPLARFIQGLTGESHLAFFDAIAPIVHAESVDMTVAWRQSRYDKAGDGGEHAPGEGDYINCPLDRDQYFAFVEALNSGEKAEFREWEKDTPYFDGCMPIEVMAERGPQTLRFGPMKPVGLRDPRTGRRPFAVVQLRQDNAAGTLLNIVGFQTKLKHGEQVRIFRTVPGLQQAEFARLGGLHRNSFIRSPVLLDPTLRLGADLRIHFAGQITGCEGYVESAAVGLMAGLFLSERVHGRRPATPPAETAMGALLSHITGGAMADSFQPMNVNFGLFPALEGVAKGRDRKAALAARAKAAFGGWAERFASGGQGSALDPSGG